jgi:hypothetical protein
VERLQEGMVGYNEAKDRHLIRNKSTTYRFEFPDNEESTMELMASQDKDRRLTLELIKRGVGGKEKQRYSRI